MGRVVLTICRSCRPRKRQKVSDPTPYTGEVLYKAVKALRRERGLKEVFAVEKADCLKMCDSPCALEYSGKKRSTYGRIAVNAVTDVVQVVEAAVAYADLTPGRELPERVLPGESDD